MWTSADDPPTPSGDLRTRRAHRRRRIVHRAAAHVPKRLGCDAQALRYLQNACAPEKSAPELYGEMYRECITTFLPTTRLHAVLLVSSAVQNVMPQALPIWLPPPEIRAVHLQFHRFSSVGFQPNGLSAVPMLAKPQKASVLRVPNYAWAHTRKGSLATDRRDDHPPPRTASGFAAGFGKSALRTT